ncbi:DUF1501 domain-containing protein [Frigoriglobus tundricola]|uniref:Uncharacterized DUF1501 protein, type 2 n=1 Tax=Frigoriglobus tundricola TaxID=2774151 RepID=A0A6M5YL57_9BACT|nr:DUF1501 domain-containing protein [Frigoriglobus tundricola]QJW94314.1 Uncharacterized DUF1501 protein, type 2 [Frigoriglobus tundricola]
MGPFHCLVLHRTAFMPHSHPTRRDFIRATAATAAGLAASQTASAGSRPPLALGTAKSCIFINMVGGPAHLDTFDPKPDAPSDVRGPFRPIRTATPGVHLSELFPKLAKLTDRFSLIRSMHHTAPPVHECGFQLLNTGRLFRDGPEWPSMGCVVSFLNGDTKATAFPPRHFVSPVPEVNTGIQASHGFGPGFLGERVPFFYGGVGCADEWMYRWMEERNEVNPQYGPTAFGQNCAGCPEGITALAGRFITINQFSTVFDSPSWDCHAAGGSLRTDLSDIRNIVAPGFDTAFSALLTDLEARGQLESTLVVATGEFGRTPKLNSNGGRDHWAGCWTALVAGGGVKGGRVIGRSDRTGSEPADRPVTPQELVASIFHALGVAPDATIPGPDGAPVAVYPGAPVAELF